MNEPATWERPKTIKRYLHPPKSDRLFTLWAEGKVVFGEENVTGFNVGDGYKAGRSYYFELESCIAWLLHGKNAEQFDFKNVKNIITDDGVPVHAVSYALGDVTVTMEGLSNITRKATCFCKITVKNNGSEPVRDQLMLMLRSGKEAELVFGAPNGYVRHEPDVQEQKKLPATWKQAEDHYTDGVRYLHLQSATPTQWDEATGMIALPYALAAGEEAKFFYSLDMGETASFDYEQEKASHRAFWEKELQRLNKLPKALQEDPDKLKMIRHLTAMLMQTFAYVLGTDHIVSRQGGMMSIVWPSEALFTIEALSKVGDFGEYIEPVFATHFDVMQQPDGEVRNYGAFWGSVTASVLYSFCKYCQSAGKAFYDRYRDNAFKAYHWIKQTRRSVVDTDTIAGGLFPGVHANDWEHEIQGWTLTDVFNLFAMEELYQLAQRFGDEGAVEVKAEHDAYLADMKRHFQKWLDVAEGSDELKIPLKPIGDDQHLIDDGYPLIYHGRFILCGVIEKEEDIRRVYRYMVNHGISKDGFYGYMPYPNGNRHIWYMSFPDFYWFKIWLKLGEREKAQQIIDHQIQYAMSDEYVMVERYEDNCPYYCPWSPNASASGRIILMLSWMAE